MPDFAILSTGMQYFMCPMLAKALKCDLFLISKETKDFYETGVSASWWDRVHPIPCKNLIIIGTIAFICYQAFFKNYNSVTVILCDSNCAAYKTSWNTIAKDNNNVRVFAMPDWIKYCEVAVKPIYQAIYMPKVIHTKNNNIVNICHSPHQKGKYKGTDKINSVITKLSKRYELNYNELNVLSWKDCIKEKAKCHIFIDQIISDNPEIPQSRWNDTDYRGGLGQSGLEGMLLGSCVIVGADRVNTRPHLETAPVLWTDYNYFERTLETMLDDSFFRKIYASCQKAWAEKHTNPEFVTEYLTKNI